jgi:membrane protein YdbS with pleckstrin-like domain
MKCPKCGREAPAESAFCPGCGTSLAAPDTAAAATKLGGPRKGSGRNSPPAEEEIWSGSYSAKAMVGTFVAAGVLTLLGLVVAIAGGPAGGTVFVIAAMLVWGGLALLYLYRRMTVRYRLTTYRFFHETGLLSRVGNRVEVIDIDDVTVSQGVIERMFGVGTVRISSSDKTDPELTLPGIDDARRVADLIDGARRAERQRRGLHLDAPLEA